MPARDFAPERAQQANVYEAVAKHVGDLRKAGHKVILACYTRAAPGAAVFVAPGLSLQQAVGPARAGRGVDRRPSHGGRGGGLLGEPRVPHLGHVAVRAAAQRHDLLVRGVRRPHHVLLDDRERHRHALQHRLDVEPGDQRRHRLLVVRRAVVGGWSCPTVVPWLNLHPSHYMDYSRNAWGNTETSGAARACVAFIRGGRCCSGVIAVLAVLAVLSFVLPYVGGGGGGITTASVVTRPSAGAPRSRPASQAAGSPGCRGGPRRPLRAPADPPRARRAAAAASCRRARPAARRRRRCLGEALHRVGHPLRVPAQRRRQADPVQRPVRQAVAAADRLRHRVREGEARAAERSAAVARTAQQLRARLEVARRLDDARQPLGDQPRARQRVLVRVLVVPDDVERLGAVCERVHRRADRRLARQVERQLRLVDDSRGCAPRAAAAHLPLRVAHAVVRRPLGTRVRRRHRHERHARRRRDRLAEIDRAAAAERDDAAAAPARLRRRSAATGPRSSACARRSADPSEGSRRAAAP